MSATSTWFLSAIQTTTPTPQLGDPLTCSDMDEFMVQDAFSPGCFGTAMLVTDRRSGVELTLKKVECLDEGRANQALDEARCMLNFKHPNIVRYRKLFITWDQTISSVFLSMVMNCPYRTTLDAIITTHRDSKKKIRKHMLKAFLGQMTYALAYLHKDNIAHRNIKPSNIELSGPSTFVLFDFEPATITRDRARVKQRVKKNLKRWLAPECLSLNQWTERSDIWSLGCVVLDMVTCHLLDMDSSVTQLLRLHQDQTPLKVIVYSGLNQVLTKMFRCHPNKRANIWELVEDSLVKSCLQHCGISIDTIERMVPSGVHEPPLHQGLDNSLEFMERYGNVESVQLSVLAFLLSDENNMLYRVSDVVQAVTMAMHRHQRCAGVQLEACQVLQRRITALLAESGDISSLCSRALVIEICRTIQNFPRHTQLLARAFLLLSCLAPHDQAAVEMMVSPEGIKEVVRTITTFPEERDVITSCCKYLRSLTGLGVRVDGVALTGAVEGLCVASNTHTQDSEVMECVCAALCFLTLQGVSDEKDVEESVLLLMHTLICHNTHITMVKHILQALTNLLKTSELAAFRLLLAPDGGRGLGLIKEVKLRHHDNPEVIGGMCGLLRAMAQYDSVVSEMMSDQIPEDMEEIVLQFEENEEVVLLARQTLDKLKDSQ